MKYYSEITNQKYETQEACENAEREFKAKAEQIKIEKAKVAEARKEAANKVEEARDTFIAAKKLYDNAISDFVKKYGSYHTTINKETIDNISSMSDFIEKFFF